MATRHKISSSVPIPDRYRQDQLFFGNYGEPSMLCLACQHHRWAFHMASIVMGQSLTTEQLRFAYIGISRLTARTYSVSLIQLARDRQHRASGSIPQVLAKVDCCLTGNTQVIRTHPECESWRLAKFFGESAIRVSSLTPSELNDVRNYIRHVLQQRGSE